MKRRKFIHHSIAGATLPFWLQACDSISADSFPIDVQSDYEAGHLIMESADWMKRKPIETDVLIVGGGASGVAAAYAHRKQDYLLVELSNRMGGTAGTVNHRGTQICQGAHYELAYPDNYGEEVLQLLESLNIIKYESWRKLWTFTDSQHIIPYQRRQQCFINGEITTDVLPDGAEKMRFLDFLSQYRDKMPLPSRLASENERLLNDITFTQFLSPLNLSPSFIRGLDYHMMDDYGGTCHQVSAFAGIHYFMCRPYYQQTVDLFSPPVGNAYFINRMLAQLSPEKIRTHQLVKSIVKSGERYQAEVLDVNQKYRYIINANKIVYAGQKHALKYIFEEESRRFNNDYAPWMVINIVCPKEEGVYGFWQNEFLGENPSFLGFIDSSVQDTAAPYRIFTAYYCLKPSDRAYLTTIEENKKRIVDETIQYITRALRQSISPLAAYIKIMGHAMAIPKPGYLFKDANNQPDAQMTYAGIDNGRLPLLYEALDSGLQSQGFNR
ncbi:MAG: NAD(P)-binding protein [Cyclobacteriaceae bacterium]